MNDETAVCRGCGRTLRGKPYRYGGRAYVPETNEQAKVNHFGGYVCSRDCDYRALLHHFQSMPGCGGATRPGQIEMEAFRRNWPEAR